MNVVREQNIYSYLFGCREKHKRVNEISFKLVAKEGILFGDRDQIFNAQLPMQREGSKVDLVQFCCFTYTCLRSTAMDDLYVCKSYIFSYCESVLNRMLLFSIHIIR